MTQFQDLLSGYDCYERCRKLYPAAGHELTARDTYIKNGQMIDRTEYQSEKVIVFTTGTQGPFLKTETRKDGTAVQYVAFSEQYIALNASKTTELLDVITRFVSNYFSKR